MMRSLSYGEYLDKVYGCFLGKCIGGTAGGPAEGRKELLDYPLHEPLLHIALPNDDLDLQIIWLELLEREGIHITARDMAKNFHEKIPYGPGEYGFAKKNIGHGIYPPVSGTYNNRYYKNGMGCPIRSEIWACLFPGAPELARPYVMMDGSIDHEYDSIEAEYFLASAESMAFHADSTDMPAAIRSVLSSGLTCMTPDTKIHRALSDTIRWCGEGRDWRYVRSMILRHYGHSDCTNLYQNMSFILLTLLYGGGDIRETIRLGLACGYDTDCICASAASILGILRGADRMLNTDGFTDTGLKIEVLTKRREGSIKSLAESVCAAGMTMSEAFAVSGATAISDKPDFTRLPTAQKKPEFDASVVYTGDPVLVPGEVSVLVLTIQNNGAAREATVKISAPEGVVISPDSLTIHVDVNEAVRLPLRARVAEGVKKLNRKNLFALEIVSGDASYQDDACFGLAGAEVWYRFGPFLQNNRDLTDLPPHENYHKRLAENPGDSLYDVVRDYHLNNFADIQREVVSEALPFTAITPDGSAEREPEVLYTREALFDLAKLQAFEGPHLDYLLQAIESPEERRVELAVGHTAPFKLWLNGDYIGGSDRSTWWTAENKHFSVKLKAGENILILKCAQVTDHAKYSVIFRLENGRWRQWEDMASLIR